MVNVAVVLKRTRSRSPRPAVAPRTSPHLTLTLASRGPANIRRVFGSDLKERSGATYSALALAFKHYLKSRRFKKKKKQLHSLPCTHTIPSRRWPILSLYLCVLKWMCQAHAQPKSYVRPLLPSFLFGIFLRYTHVGARCCCGTQEGRDFAFLMSFMCFVFNRLESRMSKRNVPKRIIPLNS